MKPKSPTVYEFGPFRLEPGEFRLSRQNREISLRPKLFELLTVLVERRGEMLEKDELIKVLWPGINVLESNLTVSVNELRRALGDGKYIETVTRRGYRFAADVRILGVGAADDPPMLNEAEPPGGAMPLYSPLYIERSADADFHSAIARRDSIVLIEGPRQIGKTSLLARGLQRARESGSQVALTDLQHLMTSAFSDAEKLVLTLAEMIADQLGLSAPHLSWNSFLSASTNFERYFRREVMTQAPTGLVWGLDEADRLFNYEYSSEIFGLFRSWHNLRALEPSGPWRRLTLTMAYATEAQLFITDLNQSPFNVGTRLTLEDFSVEKIAELNARYGSPLQSAGEVSRFYYLINGHPYLAQRGLYEMIRRRIEIADVEALADHDEGPFGNHLRRMVLSIERDPSLCDALRGFLRGQSELTTDQFHRLRSAGVLGGGSPEDARPRCELYRRYLRKRLL
jgi:DNA-binding winged helix-turn-helix (wHTH) protein